MNGQKRFSLVQNLEITGSADGEGYSSSLDLLCCFVGGFFGLLFCHLSLAVVSVLENNS